MSLSRANRQALQQAYRHVAKAHGVPKPSRWAMRRFERANMSALDYNRYLIERRLRIEWSDQ